jgi:hypothetical protein
MPWWRKLATAIAALVVLWFVVLGVFGWIYAPTYGAHVTERVGDSIGATGTIDDTELSLMRGRVILARLAVARDDSVGKLTLTVDHVRCDIAPFGWALVDSTCDTLAVRGVRLEASSGAVFHVNNPKRRPVHARAVVIDDAELAFAPSALVPALGRIAITVEHAEAGETVFRTPLSWLFALRVLRARFEVAGVTVRVTYDNGKLSAEGSLFGSKPVSVPVQFPAASTLADARAEIKALVDTGEDIGSQLVSKRATDWLRSKL